MQRVLIVEDDLVLSRVLEDNFTLEGYSVKTASDGEAGLEAALGDGADLIVLDIMLPKLNGFEICESVRRRGVETPVIMLTAKGQESDVVLGLNLGADDYVTKPFGMKELLARARALLRRHNGERTQVVRFGACELDLERQVLQKRGEPVKLTPKEYRLLAFLAQRPGRPVTRDTILDAVWGHAVFVSSRSVDRCVTTLRSKIEEEPQRPQFLHTVREVGYRFDVPDE